jgi:hypothetical protein
MESDSREQSSSALMSFPEANFLDEFLTKSSGLLNAFAPIFSEAAAKLENAHGGRYCEWGLSRSFCPLNSGNFSYGR